TLPGLRQHWTMMDLVAGAGPVDEPHLPAGFGIAAPGERTREPLTISLEVRTLAVGHEQIELPLRPAHAPIADERVDGLGCQQVGNAADVVRLRELTHVDQG